MGPNYPRSVYQTYDARPTKSRRLDALDSDNPNETPGADGSYLEGRGEDLGDGCALSDNELETAPYQELVRLTLTRSQNLFDVLSRDFALA